MKGRVLFITKVLSVGLIVTIIGMTMGYSGKIVEEKRIEISEDEALELFDKGYAAYEKGDLEEAELNWFKVHEEHEGTSIWAMTTYNLGILNMEQESYGKAIKIFLTILSADVNNKDPGASVMEAYRNYQHKAALEISFCHEMLGDLDMAYDFMIKARDEYPYQSWCGTCMAQHFEYIDYEMDRLFILMDVEENQEICYSLKYHVKIDSKTSGSKNVTIPVPTYSNSSYQPQVSELFLENLIIQGEYEGYDVFLLEWDLGMNISFKDDLIINCEILIPYGSVINTSRIGSSLSLTYDNYYYGDPPLNMYLNDTTGDGITISLGLEIIDHPPDWNYVNIEYSDFEITENGWDHHYFDEW